MNETAPSPSPEAIVAALREMQTYGDDHFVIVEVGPRDHNLFGQFVAADAEDGILAEVVGNAFLPDDHQLSEEQEAHLTERGWREEEDAGWHRTWRAVSTDEERRRIVLEVLETLREVHGARGELRVRAHLPGSSDETVAALQERGVAVDQHKLDTTELGCLLIGLGLALLAVAFLLI